VDVEGCTLCLACVGSCPANALADNPDKPQLRFTEAACVQCGLCKATCPEKVISLEPRYNFSAEAMSPIVLNEEEPFECIRCGKPFGAKSTVERIAAELKGKHWMFQDDEQTDLIRMCDNCRVIAISERGDDPFATGEPRRVRTTDDYLAAEEKARKTGKSIDDFLN
ncbi:MAG: 4Fe-4S ferredoxin, partial [Alphaproteobacteria bacterium]